MSTKIRNGYILIEGADPFAFLRGLRAELNPVRDRLDAALIGKLIADRIDRAIISGEDVPDNVASAAYRAWMKEQDGLRDLDRDKDPNGFEASIGQDPETGRHHLLAFTERNEYLWVLDGMGALREYGYWDSTERPDDVAAEDWAARAAAWDRVMPSGVPVESMLNFTLRGRHSPGMITLVGDRSPLVLANAQSPLARARALAVSKAFDVAAAERGLERFSEAMHVLRDLEKAAQGFTPRLAAHLPELTWENIFSGHPVDPEAALVLGVDAAELLALVPAHG